MNSTMPNHHTSRAHTACVLTLMTIVVGCGSGDATTQPPPTTQNPPAVASVSLDRTALSVEQAKTSTLVATARDASGATLTGRTIAWSSDASGIATVSQGGV